MESGKTLVVENTPSPQEKQMQEFVKQILVGRMFIGTFQEKRYVEALKSYRDVIVISEEETELLRDVEAVRNRIRNHHSAHHWIGITAPDIIGAPVGYCLWVQLSEEVFGSYWYKISKVKFFSNETALRLKIIRPVSIGHNNTSLSFKKMTKPIKLSNVSTNRQLNNPQNNANMSLETLGGILASLCTVHNTTEAVKFLFLLLTALCTGLLKAVEFLGDFTIKLLKETSNFVQSVTPICLACINLIAKIIGGFYLLILSMWRDRNGPTPIYKSPYVNRLSNNTAYDQHNTVYYRRGLPPPQRKSGVVITQLDN